MSSQAIKGSTAEALDLSRRMLRTWRGRIDHGVLRLCRYEKEEAQHPRSLDFRPLDANPGEVQCPEITQGPGS